MTRYKEDENDTIVREIRTSEDGRYILLDDNLFLKSELNAIFGGALNRKRYIPSANKCANPSPLGFCAFALSAFLNSLIHVGVIGASNNQIVIGVGAFHGGIIQLISGMWEIACENIFAGTVLSSFGGFWMAYSAIYIPWFDIKESYNDPNEFRHALGLFTLGWLIYAVMVSTLALRSTWSFLSFFVLLCITLLFLTLGDLFVNDSLTKSGGYTGFVLSFLALYNAYEGVVNNQHIYVLPWCKPSPIFYASDKVQLE